MRRAFWSAMPPQRMASATWPAGAIATLTVTVDAHIRPYRARAPYRVRCRDETGFLNLVFFHVKGDYLERLLPVGATRVVSGKIEHYNNEIQITHPDHIVDLEGAKHLPEVEAVYPLTEGLPLRHEGWLAPFR